MKTFNAQSTPISNTTCQLIKTDYRDGEKAVKSNTAMIDSLYAEGYRSEDFAPTGSTPVSMVVGEIQQEQPRYVQIHGLYTSMQPAKTQELLALSLADRKDRTEAEQATCRIAKKKITDKIKATRVGLDSRVAKEMAAAWELHVIASIPKADMDKAVQSGGAAIKNLVDAAKKRAKEDEHPLVQRTAVKLAQIIKGLKADGRYVDLRNQLDTVCKGFEKEHEALKAKS
tara:strand:+ start:144 stop:827 length:684 start_codon:yes stop_codon:yes gene_type:complete